MKLTKNTFWLNEAMKSYIAERGTRSFTLGDLFDWCCDSPFFEGDPHGINWHCMGIADYDIKPDLSQIKELVKAGLVKAVIEQGHILNITYLGDVGKVPDWEYIIPDPEGKRRERFERSVRGRKRDVERYSEDLEENFEWKIGDAVGDYFDAMNVDYFTLDQFIEELKRTGWWIMIRDLPYPNTKGTVLKLLQPILDSGSLVYDEEQKIYIKNEPSLLARMQTFLVEEKPIVLEDFPRHTFKQDSLEAGQN